LKDKSRASGANRSKTPAVIETLSALPEAERIQCLKVLASSLGLSERFNAALGARSEAEGPVERQPIEWTKQLPESVRRKAAKQKWANRAADDKRTIIEFILANYGDRMHRGFTLADLRQADEGLCRAYQQWLLHWDRKTEKRNKPPIGFYLPTEDEWNDRCINHFRLDPNSVPDDQVKRLLSVMSSRARRGKLKL
jgi:hypothetical protein